MCIFAPPTIGWWYVEAEKGKESEMCCHPSQGFQTNWSNSSLGGLNISFKHPLQVMSETKDIWGGYPGRLMRHVYYVLQKIFALARLESGDAYVCKQRGRGKQSLQLFILIFVNFPFLLWVDRIEEPQKCIYWILVWRFQFQAATNKWSPKRLWQFLISILERDCT